MRDSIRRFPQITSSMNSNRSNAGPKVSVSVITYNHGDMIAGCLESILAQDVDFDFEIVVGDDCSTDGTQEVVRRFCDEYPGIIRPIFAEKNAGDYGNTNFFNISEQCCGQYIAHIDGDDVMLPGKLQKQADFLDAHPECVMCVHTVHLMDRAGVLLPGSSPSQPKPEITDLEYLILNGCFFDHSSKMYRLSAKLPRQNKRTCDYYMHVWQAFRGNIGFLNEVLGVHRIHFGGHTARKEVQLVIFESYRDAYRLAADQGVSPDLCSKGLSHSAFMLAVFSFLVDKQEYELFRQYIEKANAYKKLSGSRIILYKLRGFPRTVSMSVRMLMWVREKLWNFSKR